MDLFTSLEVNITQEEAGFVATCSVFPDCRGEGVDCETAISQLSDSVSDFISGTLKKSVSSVLNSDRYSELVLDTSQAKKGHTRVFHLDPNAMGLVKSLFVKVGDVPVKPEKVAKEDVRVLIQSFQEQHLSDVLRSSEPPARAHHVSRLMQGPPEGLAFGFPLSFN